MDGPSLFHFFEDADGQFSECRQLAGYGGFQGTTAGRADEGRHFLVTPAQGLFHAAEALFPFRFDALLHGLADVSEDFRRVIRLLGQLDKAQDDFRFRGEGVFRKHIVPDLFGHELEAIPEKGGFAFIGELRVPLRVGKVGGFAGEQVFGIVHLEGIFQKR